MPNQTANRLKNNIDRILTIWEEKVNQQIRAAHHQETIALRNSLPEYLLQLVDALSNTIDRTSARERSDKINSTRVGKKHGEDRAGSKNYTLDQLISEYHILRQVLCDVMEEEAPLTEVEREVIVCSIEQAVNDAATEYSDILKNLKEKFSNTLAHDLRNPITSAKISAELVLRKLDANDSLASKMKLIISNMERINQMISDLLDASRMEAGEDLPIEVKACDLNQVLRTAVSELSLAYLRDFNVQSIEKCEGFWDKKGIRRLIENLVTNAIKYGEENSKITLSLIQNKDFVTLSVHNFGRPISPKELPLLFEQFKRSKSVKDKVGWGLGLTMVKDMVDAHKGSIHVESEESKGTTFYIHLPKDSRKSAKLNTGHEKLNPQIAKS